MIGLFREPGSIKVSQWDVPMDEWNQPVDESTRDLQRSISKYAYHYDCPHVFVFDSHNLLIVQISADSREQLKSPATHIDYCLIPHNLDLTAEITIQTGLCLLAWRGWMRLSATIHGRTVDVEGFRPLYVEGSIRRYEYWSGRPMWETGGFITVEHPNGWRRRLETVKTSTGRRGYWIWERPGRKAITDTGNVFQ